MDNEKNKIEEAVSNNYELISLDELEELEEIVCPSSNGCCGCC
jgi:hypothetical protein